MHPSKISSSVFPANGPCQGPGEWARGSLTEGQCKGLFSRGSPPHTQTHVHPPRRTLPVTRPPLSPPAPLPVDIPSINLSRCSAFSVHLSTPCLPPPTNTKPTQKKSPLPISHQSLQLPPLLSTLLLRPFRRAHQLFPGPFREASPFSTGVREGLCPCAGSLLYNDSPLY